MEIEKITDLHAVILISRDELSIISNALNEVCNGIYLDDDFQTRIGVTIEEAKKLLASINAVNNRG